MKNILLTSLVLSLALAVACSQPPPKPFDGKDETQDPTLEQGDGDGSPKEKEKGQKEEEKDPSDSGSNTGDKPDPDKPDPMKPVDPTPGGKDPIVTPTPTPTPTPEDTVKDPGTQGDGRVEFQPDNPYKDEKYNADPNSSFKNGIPKGEVKDFKMFSKDSKIYRGQDEYLKEKGDFERKGSVYIPANYSGEELPVIFVGDGSWGQHRLLIPILDNLIAAKKIPKMAAVFLNPGPLGGGDGPGSQRSFEYDSVDDKFASFVETEVFPKVQKEFNIKFTSNPEGRATLGGSSSGAMAFSMAWFRPDLFRRVLTYSGTFVNRKETGYIKKGAWEYHSESKLIQNAAKKPLRIYLQVGEKDNNFNNGDNNWMQANENMYTALSGKGYHVRFHFANGVGHINHSFYAKTLPSNLIWLWAGYPIK